MVMTRMADGNDTFIKVSNADVYRELQTIKAHLVRIEQQTTLTNGKVRLAHLNIKGLWGAIIFVGGVVLWILQYLIGK